MILLIPINGAISVKQRNMQTALMRYKDARLKLMNEVLSGIKVRTREFITEIRSPLVFRYAWVRYIKKMKR